MATRIFEIARDLGVTSKMVLTKCRAEGLDVKNHMSTVSAGLQATIREWFTEESRSPHTAVETAAHVDLGRARAQARRSQRKKALAEKAEEAPVEAATEELAEQHAAGTAVAEAPAEVAPRAVAEPLA
ncbi:MAG: translation initiation factor IF-2 N-terminal domain-containing protein, partial [Phycisphaerae bacterium]